MTKIAKILKYTQYTYQMDRQEILHPLHVAVQVGGGRVTLGGREMTKIVKLPKYTAIDISNEPAGNSAPIPREGVRGGIKKLRRVYAFFKFETWVNFCFR